MFFIPSNKTFFLIERSTRNATWLRVLPFLLLFSCNTAESDTSSFSIAKVGNKVLTQEDISYWIPDDSSKEDSTQLANSLIEEWIREMVLLSKAEEELPEDLLNVERRLEKYRRSLLIYEYEREYVKQRLDTSVSEEEINEHYNKNKDDFKLKDYIIKVIFVKLEKDHKDKEKVARWMKSMNNDDLLELEKFCVENAVSYFNDLNNWIQLKDLKRELPGDIENEEQFLRNGRSVQMEDDEFDYFVSIRDFKLRDAISPLSFERENIKNRILNYRTTELIKEMRVQAMKDAQNLISRPE